MKRLIRALVMATLAGWAIPAGAQDLGKFRDWSAHRFTEEGREFCLMWTQPQKSEGKYSRRGEVYATVTHRPALREFGVVAFEMGYPFAPDNELSVSIDGGSAVRFPADEDGDSEDESIRWHPSPEVNRDLVESMREGLAMIAKGRSKRGTKTVDTYSLHGFAAAYRAISKACGAP